MRGRSVDLPLLRVEVFRGERERPQSLKHDATDPVHRACGESQLVDGQTESDPAEQVTCCRLVTAPELRAEHVTVGRDDPEVRVRREASEDVAHVLLVTE